MVIIGSIHKCEGFNNREYLNQIVVREREDGTKSASLILIRFKYCISVTFCPLCGEKLAD